MFTYRRDLERKGWHRPVPVRVVLIVLALFVGLFGWLAWTLEQDKGGWEGSGLGHHMVEEDGVAGHARVWNESGEMVFEGANAEEVEAWIESQRNRDFTTPTLLIAGSAILFIAAVGPSPRKPEPRNASTQVGVQT